MNKKTSLIWNSHNSMARQLLIDIPVIVHNWQWNNFQTISHGQENAPAIFKEKKIHNYLVLGYNKIMH